MDKISFNLFWWIEIAVAILLVVGIQTFSSLLIKKLQKKLDSVAFLRAIKGPWILTLWSLTVVFLVSHLYPQSDQTLALSFLIPLRNACIIGAIAWFLLGWKKEIERSLQAHHSTKIDPTSLQIISRLTTIVVLFVAVLVILQLLGINTSPLLALGSVGAASIGFASKDVIANFCSGLSLQISRTFVIGEEIALPEKSLTGIIEKIGWFTTTIRDFERREVYLPNNCFSTLLLINVSRKTHRHLKQTLYLSFESAEKIQPVAEKIRQRISQHLNIDSREPIHVHLRKVSEWSMELCIEAFAKVIPLPAFLELQQQILIEAYEVCKEGGIQPAVLPYTRP